MDSKTSSQSSADYRREYYKKLRSEPITLQDILDAGERFWSWVHIGEPEDCWKWFGASQLVGYGQFGIKGRNMVASRVSWMLENREIIPKGKIIMHLCDNPTCVNPAHLRLGTPKDNSQDASNKGRLGY